MSEVRFEDRTLFVFLSENGAAATGDNGPLRGGKGDLWEGGIRVPCIIRYPDVVPAGSVCDAFLTALEIVPTALQLAGMEAPEEIIFDGDDMLPVLTQNNPAVRDAMFWQRQDQQAARIGDLKWLRGDASGLYDLATDPGEDHDLSAERPEKAAELAARFEAWREEMAASDPRGPFRDY
jgi:arylsulfatase A-like enzyme